MTANQAELTRWAQNKLAGFSKAEQDFIIDEIARTTASRIEETSVEAEREATREILTSQLDSPTDFDAYDQSTFESFAEALSSRGASAKQEFERHFEIDPVAACGLYVVAVLGAMFVVTGGDDPAVVWSALQSAPTYLAALASLKTDIDG